ncbi:MAG: U32 family peptidase [Clostridia bacterium]|nr:U32 family peptidase [Clostridia bacterium]
MEILSPAGSPEALRAAVLSGADAVYFGASAFNARMNAANFTDEVLQECIRFCHERGVACHGTLNTLVSQRELLAALATAEKLVRAGIDALIVQDVGLASELKKRTDVPLHASTQLTVHNLDGILFAQQMGFDRVVLSREVSRKELEYMAARSPLELEIFGHGALCMCYSGQCYMSSLIGGRSGNRGECAQPCRLPYQGGYRLSLKDLCLLKYYQELEQMGIASLKIEGRMKSPEYVSAITSAYAAAKRGEAYSPEKEEYLAGVFSRSGFTDGYYTDKIGKEMFGTRSETVHRVDLPTKEYPRLALDVTLRPVSEEQLLCTAVCGSYSAEGTLPVSPARNRSTTEEEIRDAFGALGNTAYYLKSFSAALPEGSFVPVSAVKSLRRELIDRLTQMRCLTSHAWKDLPLSSRKACPHSGRREGFFLHPDRIPENVDLDFIWLPFSAVREHPSVVSRYGNKVGFVLPRIYRETEKQDLQQLLSQWKEAGITDALCGNVGHLSLCFSYGLTPHGDYGLNVYNPVTRDEFLAKGLKSVTLSFELNGAQLRDLTTEETGVIVYGRLPFMIFRNCLKQKHGPDEQITDRMGKSFLLSCAYGCRNELWNADRLWLADKSIGNLGFQRFLFTDESRDEIASVLASYRRGDSPDFGVTRGKF